MIEERKVIDMLTEESVSVITQKFIEVDGEIQQVGKNFRASYENTVSGREALENSEPVQVIDAIYVIWGDTPKEEVI